MDNSMVEMQLNLNEKRNNFINWIEFNIDDKKVLEAAVNYFEYEEQVRKATLKLAEIDLAAAKSIDLDNKNLQNVIAQYKIDSCFNKNQSKNWLVEALKLVVLYDYTFDGLKFVRGDKTILKTDITE